MQESKGKLNLLFTSSEAEPFYKVGGLGDYAGSLPKAINKHFRDQSISADIRVVIPLHDPKTIIDFALRKVGEINLANGTYPVKCSVYSRDDEGMIFYFIKQEIPEPESNEVYGKDQHKTALKFLIFSLSVLKLPALLNWEPDIVHTNDWHTALINHQLKFGKKSFRNIKSLLTIHNLPFMGYGSEPIYQSFHIKGVDEDTFPTWALNLPLPMGISAADEIVAVSPAYAEELKTNYFAYGLENYFLAHPEKITGIINGIDYSVWDPKNDSQINQNFSSINLDQRETNKKALCDEIGFDFEPLEPLLIVISRLENQKGIDLILDALSETADKKWKAVILGSGHRGYEYAFRALERVFPKKIKAVLEYNPGLARRLYASGDMILMPSLYEPCGLSQMIAMHYGCVPVAHAVGGLKDSICVSPESSRTGFLFTNPTKEAFLESLNKAIIAFSDTHTWKNIQMNGMKADFSWHQSACHYADLYLKLAGISLN